MDVDYNVGIIHGMVVSILHGMTVSILSGIIESILSGLSVQFYLGCILHSHSSNNIHIVLQYIGHLLLFS